MLLEWLSSERQTMLTVHRVSLLVDEELARITDADLQQRVRDLLVAPYAVERDWDYGPLGQRFTCWTVLEHSPSNTGIAYCQEGFGPGDPWGIVYLSGKHMNIGMDCSWFPTLETAMRESSAASDISRPKGYLIP